MTGHNADQAAGSGDDAAASADAWAVPGLNRGRPQTDQHRVGPELANEPLDRRHPLSRLVAEAREGLSALLACGADEGADDRADGGADGRSDGGADDRADGRADDRAGGGTYGSRGLGAAAHGARAAVMDLPDGDLAGVYRELAALSAACAVATAAVIAETAARDLPTQVGERSVGGWLQRVGRLTRGQAATEQASARAVLAVPPVTRGLARGDYSPRAASILSASLQSIAELPGVSEKLYAEAESTALRLAKQLDIAQLSRALQALQEALTTGPDVDDETEAQKYADEAAKAWRERYLLVNTDTGRITGRLPIPMAQALQTALDALAAHRTRELPPEALDAARDAGAHVWVDHVEDCPADPEHEWRQKASPDYDRVAAATAAAHAAARSRCTEARHQWELSQPGVTSPDDDEREGSQADAPRPRPGQQDQSGASPLEATCACPWRVEWPLTCTCEGPADGADGLSLGDSHHSGGCPLASAGPKGHDESGEPLLRRTRAQSQADAIFELAHLGLDARLLPTQDAAPPHLTLHATPADLDRPIPTGTYPDGTVAPPGAVATVLCDAIITTVLFDEDGLLLAVASDQRTWPRRLRRAIAARDRRCSFPGCDTVPALCHVHHMVHVEHGGTTKADNGALLCPLHHALVHDLGYAARLHPRNGRPEFQPPPWVDPRRRWRQHPRYQLEHLLRTGQPPRPQERDPRRRRSPQSPPPDSPLPW